MCTTNMGQLHGSNEGFFHAWSLRENTYSCPYSLKFIITHAAALPSKILLGKINQI